MAISSPISINELSFPIAARPDVSLKPSEREREVIHLFDCFRSPLLRYALSFGLSPHDAEEVIQEVFLSLFRHLQLGRSRRNLRGWIFRVAHNLALKRRIANFRQHARMEFDESAALTHADPAPNPEQQFASRQRHERLRTVMLALPERDQRCLYLRAEGFRYREICEILGMSLGAVSLSLTRSLSRLGDADER
jgi:RNA polymerase sigma-70 factor (ECF subfamily)